MNENQDRGYRSGSIGDRLGAASPAGSLPSPTQPEKLIPGNLGIQSKSIAILASCVDSLEVALGPILAPPNVVNSATGKPERETSQRVGHLIEEHTDRVRVVAGRIQDILQRLEI